MSYQGEVLADSPTAYWPLNETGGTTITDAVASVVLTATGTPTFSVPHYVGNGIDFAANSSFSNAAPGSSFVWILGSDLTIEFMYRRDSIDVGTRCLLASRSGPSSDRQFGIFHLTGSNLLFDVGGTNNRWTTGVNISDTKWHHVIFKHRGSDGHRELWIDGRAAATSTVLPTTADATAGPLGIGTGAGSTQVNGCLAEVAMYNGKYLSDARCVAHWLEIQNKNSSFLQGFI